MHGFIPHGFAVREKNILAFNILLFTHMQQNPSLVLSDIKVVWWIYFMNRVLFDMWAEMKETIFWIYSILVLLEIFLVYSSTPFLARTRAPITIGIAVIFMPYTLSISISILKAFCRFQGVFLIGKHMSMNRQIFSLFFTTISCLMAWISLSV